jgi:hypothetical protein
MTDAMAVLAFFSSCRLKQARDERLMDFAGDQPGPVEETAAMGICDGLRDIYAQSTDDIQQLKFALGPGFAKVKVSVFDKISHQPAPAVMFDNDRSDAIQLCRE